MPFTVEDFEDLLRLLYERPEWRTRLRELILPPELFELPRIAQELAESNRVERERVARLEAEQHATRQEIHEGFAQTGEHLGRVETELATFRAETTERFEQVDVRFDRVDERFEQVDVRFDRVDERLDLLQHRTNELSSDMGDMKGKSLEYGFFHSPMLFDHLLPEAVALSREELNALLRTEVAAGRLERGDAIRVLRTDIVFRSAAQTPVSYLAVEVSWMIDASDVLRAAERATLLAKTGQQVLAAVAGRRIQPDVLDLASRRGVEVVVDNTLDDRPRVDMGA
jgi:hypothetical protein